MIRYLRNTTTEKRKYNKLNNSIPTVAKLLEHNDQDFKEPSCIVDEMQTGITIVRAIGSIQSNSKYTIPWPIKSCFIFLQKYSNRSIGVWHNDNHLVALFVKANGCHTGCCRLQREQSPAPSGTGVSREQERGLSPTRHPPSPAGLQFLLPALLVPVIHATLRQRKDPPHRLCPVLADSSVGPVDPLVRVVAPGLGGGVGRTPTPSARAHLGQLALRPPEARRLLHGSVYRFRRPFGLFAASGTLYEEANRVCHSLQPGNSATLSPSEEKQRRAKQSHYTDCARISGVPARDTNLARGSSVCLSPRSPRCQRQLVTRPATPSKGRESAELGTLTTGLGESCPHTA
ncbi:uncharacterized protein [Symphalangus syndactylus]|uniref:uncharacterized protein n=1 Tax=Symphalangus syndactylus TaxID=9590 RepID=UPI003004F095